MFTGLTLSQIIVVLVTILVSMATHEAMHAFTAHALGDTTAQEEGRLTLNPLRHIDLFTTILLPVVLILMHVPPFFAAKPVPFNPGRVKFGEYGAALVGIAGPLTNFVLAVIGAIVLHLFAGSLSSGALDTGILFIEVNISFFVFNMIPFPPLDGSRLLYAFAPEPLQELMARIESMGFFTIIFFMLLLFPFIGPTISHIVLSITQFLLQIAL